MPKPNKRKRAVALSYEEGDRAPKVIAAGAGEIAKRILELAQENDIPISQNEPLVDILAKLDLGSEIPKETYRAVAEVLAFLYRTDEAWRAKKSSSHSLFAIEEQAVEEAAEEPESE